MRISDWSSDVCSSDLLQISDFNIAGLEPVSAFIQRQRLYGRKDADQRADRIHGQMRIGDMALNALDGDPHIDGSPSADLHHVAQPVDRKSTRLNSSH